MAESTAAVAAKEEPAYVVPRGTDELTWKIAAAWAEVPVSQLLADTAPVKSAHYMAAIRVSRTLDQWLERHDEEAAARALEAAEMENDPFIRVMYLAEEFAVLTARWRDRGDAVQAVKYSSFEQSLLQVAAGIQIANDIEADK